MSTKKNKKKKEKHIVGTKELVFDIVSVLLIVILGIYFGYRSIFYYSKETKKKKVEANTLAAAIVTNNKITTEDNGLHKSKDGYYFSGMVDNNYVRAFNRLYRIVEVNSNNEVKIVSNDNEANMIYGNDNNYSTSNINLWLNKTSEVNSGIYYDTIPGVEKLLTKTSYCDGVLNNNSVTCKNKKMSSYFSILTIEDYIRALGKKSYLNNGRYSYLLGSDNDNNPLVLSDQGVAMGVSNYEGYGVRVVMTLKKNTLITGGSGSIDDPYILNQNGLDNYINKYVKLGEDIYQVISEKDNDLKLRLNDYLKVNNNYVELAFNNNTAEFSLLSRNNIGYYLNRTYYDSLGYKSYLKECTFYTGEISLNQDTLYKYTSIYIDSVVAKVGLLNMFDLNTNTSVTDYYLVNSTSTVGSMGYVYNSKGVIDEDKVQEKKKVIPVICLDKSLITTGDGSINNPYVVG